MRKLNRLEILVIFLAAVSSFTLIIFMGRIASDQPGPRPPKLTKLVPKPPSCCGDSICLMEEHHK